MTPDEPGRAEGRTYLDELWDRSPEFQALVDAAHRQYENAIHAVCAWGYCTVDIDSDTGKVFGGMGPIECPCDHLPGWKSERIAGQPKPAVAVKARGRHGSRVQRSRRRHRGLLGPQLVRFQALENLTSEPSR